jgi:hypothetical protein
MAYPLRNMRDAIDGVKKYSTTQKIRKKYLPPIFAWPSLRGVGRIRALFLSYSRPAIFLMLASLLKEKPSSSTLKI